MNNIRSRICIPYSPLRARVSRVSQTISLVSATTLSRLFSLDLPRATKETGSKLLLHSPRGIITCHGVVYGVTGSTHSMRNIVLCSLKPYNIKGKTVTTNALDSTAVLLSVMIRQPISGLEGQCHLSGNCRTVGEIVELLGKL